MSTLTFPTDIPIRRVEWSLRSRTQSFTSPLSGATQTVELPGAVWSATVVFENLTIAQARKLQAFLVRLRGQSGRFRLADPTLAAPQGTALGTPVVSGAGQTGGTLYVSGMTANQTKAFAAGDYIGIGDELKMVVVDAASDGSGLATLTIEPPIRVSPANGSTVDTTAPTCIMRLVDDEQARWAMDFEQYTNITVQCVESLI